MRALLVALCALAGLSSLGCERNPPPVAPDQPCACQVEPGAHHASGRTEITR
jgi:hypothetical protein